MRRHILLSMSSLALRGGGALVSSMSSLALRGGGALVPALAAALLVGACASPGAARGAAVAHAPAEVAAPPAPYGVFTEAAPPPVVAAEVSGTRKWWELDGWNSHSPAPPRTWESGEDEEYVLDYTHYEYGQLRRSYG